MYEVTNIIGSVHQLLPKRSSSFLICVYNILSKFLVIMNWHFS